MIQTIIQILHLLAVMVDLQFMMKQIQQKDFASTQMVTSLLQMEMLLIGTQYKDTLQLSIVE